MGRVSSRCGSGSVVNLETKSSSSDVGSQKAFRRPAKVSQANGSSRLEPVCEIPSPITGCLDRDEHFASSNLATTCHVASCCSAVTAAAVAGLRERTFCSNELDDDDDDDHHQVSVVVDDPKTDYSKLARESSSSSSKLLGNNVKLKRSAAKKMSSLLLAHSNAVSGGDDQISCDTCYLDQIFSPITSLANPATSRQLQQSIRLEPGETVFGPADGDRNNDQQEDQHQPMKKTIFEDLCECETKLVKATTESDRTMMKEINCQDRLVIPSGCSSDGGSTCSCSSDYCNSPLYNDGGPQLPTLFKPKNVMRESLLATTESPLAGQTEQPFLTDKCCYLPASFPMQQQLQLHESSSSLFQENPYGKLDLKGDKSYQQRQRWQTKWRSSAITTGGGGDDAPTLLLGQQSSAAGEIISGSDNNYNSYKRKSLLACDNNNGLLEGTVDLNFNEKKLQETSERSEEKKEQESNNNNNNNNSDQGGITKSDREQQAQEEEKKKKKEEEKEKSHMDWQNIAQRYGKMPYRHKGHIWWRLRESCFCHVVLSTLSFLFPIFTSFKGYKLPNDLLVDLMSGFTVAILHIPQGMAYGLLAGVEPINGLYVSMVPVLIMALMSKSPHMSYGTFAVISILLANCTESIKQTLRQQVSAMNGNHTSVFLDLPTTLSETSKLSSSISTQLLTRQHDLSSSGGGGGDNDALRDALVITNNHKSTDPGQQLLKNLLTPNQQHFNSPDLAGDGGSIGGSEDLIASSGIWNTPGTDSASAAAVAAATAASQDSVAFIMPTNIEILTCICLLAGLIQMAMALMRLGVLSLMFSDQLVSSFTTASAFHVATSQLGNLFDLTVPRVPDGLFKVCRIWWTFGLKLFYGFNHYTALLSLLSLLFLLNVKEIIEPFLRRRYKVATCIPSELVLMSVLVVCSWFWQFNSNYGIHIVGTVPTGLPVARPPRLDLVPLVIQDALTVAVVSFAMNLSLAQVCAKKFKYRLNPNQELFALGTTNLISSFFSCFPCASSLSRTAVQSNLGAKSQISSLFSCAIVVSVVCYFAPFFYNLPRSTLSCIILVALKGILLQVRDFYENWRRSKLDALVWLATFMFVLAFDVTYGLILGILTSLSMVFYRLLTPNYSILGQLPNTEIYVDKSAFIQCNEIDHVKIFRFNSALCYLNRDMFKSSIERLLQTTNNRGMGLFCSQQLKQQHFENTCNSHRVDYLIIDCSALSYCDYSGVSTLIEIIEELGEQNTTVYLASCPLKLINMIEKIEKTNILDHNVYPSITDAINQSRYLENRTIRALSETISTSADETCLHSVISAGLK